MTEQRDDLDGCAIDMAADPVSDDEIVLVVLGDDPVRIEAYRALFSDHDKAQKLIEALREADVAASVVDS